MRAHISSPWVTAEITCEPGEVVAVIGPNGAGKSSLLRALAGLVPGAGSLAVRGQEIGHLPPYRRSVGWVPQQPSLLGHLNARDNAAYGLRSRGVRREAARDQAQVWLTRLGVGDLGDHRPARLSGGQQARVALARALAATPALLLLDEVLGAVDKDSRPAVRRTLRDAVTDARTSALLVTHDPADVTALADRVVVLERGRVVREESPGALGLEHDAADQS